MSKKQENINLVVTLRSILKLFQPEIISEPSNNDRTPGPKPKFIFVVRMEQLK